MKETRALPHRRDPRGDGRPRNHSLPTVCGGYIALGRGGTANGRPTMC